MCAGPPEEWAAEQRLRVTGTTTVSPGLGWHLDCLRSDHKFFTLDTGFKQLNIQSNRLKRKPVLDEPLRRAALFATLKTRFSIPDDRVDKAPSIPMAELADDAAFQAFTAAWDAAIDENRRAEVAAA